MAYEPISELGKFEGELAIVPKMWDVVLDGMAAEVYFGEGEPVYAFVSLLAVDEPIDQGLFGACLWERSDGFVMTQWYETEAEYNAALRELEQKAENAEDEE